jgi:hypothetical protein
VGVPVVCGSVCCLWECVLFVGVPATVAGFRPNLDGVKKLKKLNIIKCHKNSLPLLCKCRRKGRKIRRNKSCIFVAVFPELIQTVRQTMFMAAQTEIECLSCIASYCTAYLLYKYSTNSTVCN